MAKQNITRAAVNVETDVTDIECNLMEEKFSKKENNSKSYLKILVGILALMIVTLFGAGLVAKQYEVSVPFASGFLNLVYTRSYSSSSSRPSTPSYTRSYSSSSSRPSYSPSYSSSSSRPYSRSYSSSYSPSYSSSYSTRPGYVYTSSSSSGGGSAGWVIFLIIIFFVVIVIVAVAGAQNNRNGTTSSTYYSGGNGGGGGIDYHGSSGVVNTGAPQFGGHEGHIHVHDHVNPDGSVTRTETADHYGSVQQHHVPVQPMAPIMGNDPYRHEGHIHVHDHVNPDGSVTRVETVEHY